MFLLWAATPSRQQYLYWMKTMVILMISNLLHTSTQVLLPQLRFTHQKKNNTIHIRKKIAIFAIHDMYTLRCTNIMLPHWKVDHINSPITKLKILKHEISHFLVWWNFLRSWFLPDFVESLALHHGVLTAEQSSQTQTLWINIISSQPWKFYVCEVRWVYYFLKSVYTNYIFLHLFFSGENLLNWKIWHQEIKPHQQISACMTTLWWFLDGINLCWCMNFLLMNEEQTLIKLITNW